jgi:hypothetical protein
VKYPGLYADKENCPDEGKRKAFNCVQRGHQNRRGGAGLPSCREMTAGMTARAAHLARPSHPARPPAHCSLENQATFLSLLFAAGFKVREWRAWPGQRCP